MYKRINKRIKKKEKEEALGLDDETKEMLGFPETDSDESDSSEEQSDAGSSDESDGAGEGESHESPILKRKHRGEVEDSEGSSGGDTEGSEDEDEALQDEEAEDDNPPMTISQALSDPLYSVRQGSDARECIICPGKELKHAKMVSVHVASSTHLRRMKRFAVLAARIGDENEDPRLLVAALDDSVRIAPKEKAPPNASTGPRASKKERRLAKRQRRQERRTTKKADSNISAPPAPLEQGRSATKTHASSDHVLQKKTLNRQLEGIKKHKMAKSNLRKTKLHKSLQSKHAAV